MRHAFALLLVMLVVTCAYLPSCAANADAEQGPLADPIVRAKLRDMALQASAADGVPMPQIILAVASPDRQAAEKVASGGSIVEEHEPVYVVEITGGIFTGFGADSPNGQPPQGVAVTLTIDARTFDVTDAGILKFVPDLSQISPDVVNLLAD